MSTVMDIFDLAKTLSESDRARLTDLIANTIAKNENKNEVLTEKRKYCVRILEKEVLFRYWDKTIFLWRLYGNKSK